MGESASVQRNLEVYKPKEYLMMIRLECSTFFLKKNAFSHGDSHAMQNSEERLSVQLYEKLPTIVVEKHAKLRWFQTVQTLPCEFSQLQCMVYISVFKNVPQVT
jgi:hypothetical protein